MSTAKTGEVKFAGRYSQNVFLTLKWAYQSSRWGLLVLLGFGFLGRLALLSNANIIGLWVDRFCRPTPQIQCHPAPTWLATLTDTDFVWILGSVTALGFGLSIVFRIGFSVLSARAVSQIYDETTLRTSRFPMAFFDTNPTGRIVTRFSSDYGNVFRLFGGPLAEFLSIIFDLTAMILLIGLASSYYLPAVLVVAICNFAVYKWNQTKLRTTRRELSASRSPSVAHFAETVQGASSIRTYNRERAFADRFARLDQHFLQQKIKVVRNITQFSFQMNALTALLLLLTGLSASLLIQRGLLSVGSLGVAFGFIALSGNTVQMFFEWLAQFEEAMIGVERLDHYLRLPIEPGARLPNQAQFPTPHWTASEPAVPEIANFGKNLSAPVEFRDVHFRYSPQLPWVLKGVSFAIPAGQKWGVIGRTGSGKSSLIQALMGLYPIAEGQIQIDGRSAFVSADQIGSPVDLETYRSAVGFIAQEPILFKASLRENLIGGKLLSDDLLVAALKKVGLEEWANPAGLRTPIEEKGKNLSQGEKQLICLARCLLQKCPVVILDEATSSVDPRSEETMVRATEDFFVGRTQIIIAHRLTTLQRCDQILWLHDGQVRMIGSPEKVLHEFRQSHENLEVL